MGKEFNFLLKIPETFLEKNELNSWNKSLKITK